MRWVPDRTGRFHRRPHYDPAELDFECEVQVTDFLKVRNGSLRYPITTDELTVLVEMQVSDLDLYADLTGDGEDIEGVTDFFPGKKPRVRISKRLSTDPRLENRLRTTLTHELTHVRFHTFMFDLERANSLFASPEIEINRCNRDSIIGASQTDWMEWQAGYGCGAYLMPASELVRVVDRTVSQSGCVQLASAEGANLIETVATQFCVSRDAARVRLLQHKFLLQSGPLTESLF